MDLLLELSTLAVAIENLPVKRERYGKGIGLPYVDDFPQDERFDELLEAQALIATVDLFTSKNIETLYEKAVNK